MKEPVPILCAANVSFIMPLCVMLASLVTHFDPARWLDLHIVENGFSEEDREQIHRTLEMNRPGLENISLTWHLFDRTLLHADLPRHRRITADAFSRLLAPLLLPHLNRIIYLDCDLVVLADVSKLYDSIQDDAILHAVQEVAVPYISSPHGIADYEARGLRPDARIFNSGVLVMSLRRWREENISARALDYLRHQPSIVFFMDQAALNSVAVDQWIPLDHRWNQSWPILFPQLWNAKGYAEADWKMALREPFIVHYSGDDKPWNRNHLAPRSSYFFRYLKKTPFRNAVHKGLAAWLESLLGFRGFFFLWSLARHIFYAVLGRPYVKDQRGQAVARAMERSPVAEDPVPILCAANAAYLMPLCVMLASLITHFKASRPLVIYIVGSDFSEADKKKVLETVLLNRPTLQNVEIRWPVLNPSLLAGDLPSHKRLSADALSRLFAPALLPELDSVLYLDSDLVVERDLSVLYDGADRSASLCAVHDLAIPLVSSGLGVFDYRELGLDPQSRFFNSGLLFINLKKWREENTTQLVVDYLRKNGGNVFLLDQGALNAVLANKWSELDQAYNQSWTVFFPSLWSSSGYTARDWRAARDHPAIVHFAGSDKPWNRDNLAPRTSFFFRYLHKTPFRGTVRKGFAATTEGLIGFKAYYHLWSIGRHLACWIKREPFVTSGDDLSLS